MDKLKKESLFLTLIIVFTLILGLLLGINYAKTDTSTSQIQNINISSKEKTYDKINLNKSTKKELKLLPNVGDKTAELIIEYRKNHGGFQTVNELLNIPNINRKTFENIKDKVEV